MAGEGWRWSWAEGFIEIRRDGDRAVVTAEVARPGHDLVVLHESDAPPPRPGSWEIRASGLWVDAVEEEAGARWTIGVEAFALAVGDRADAVGDRVPLGFDLEWERTGPDGAEGTPAHVHGEVLVGRDALEVDGPGAWARR